MKSLRSRPSPVDVVDNLSSIFQVFFSFFWQHPFNGHMLLSADDLVGTLMFNYEVLRSGGEC
jgi:hypothetical protein